MSMIASALSVYWEICDFIC